jgi:hypothetical protein
MGGNALKHVKTERKNVIDYQRIKTHILEELNKYVVCKALIEAPEKESFGDLDVGYISDKKFEIQDLIKELFNPTEIVSNGPITSFDYDSFQIDLIKSASISEFDSKMFYFSYGDLGCLIGKMMNFYKIKFGDCGLWIEIDNKIDGKSLGLKSCVGKKILLSTKPNEICDFLGLNYEHMERGFTTRVEVFEWLCSSKYFIKGIFNIGNGADRKRMENRKLYIDFMKWLWGGDGTPTEPKPEKIYIQELSIKNFNKRHELDIIVNEVKVREVRKEKYNGTFFIDRGIKPCAIIEAMRQFEKKIETEFKTDFFEWLDSVEKADVCNQLQKFFKLKPQN